MSDDAAALAALKKKFEQRSMGAPLEERGRKERRAMRGGRDGRVGGASSVVKVQLNVRIDERLKHKMTSLADARGYTFEEFLTELVGLYEKRGEQKERVA